MQTLQPAAKQVHAGASPGARRQWRPLFVGDRRHLRLFLQLFVPMSVLLCVLWLASLYVDLLVDYQQQRLLAREFTQRAQTLVGKELKTFSEDLRVVAAAPNLVRLVHGDRSARPAVERDFAVFVSQKPAITQLRYLDRRGNEIVRIDRRGETVLRVDGSALQNKRSRYYFRDSIGLPAGSIYVSRLDLNVEHGRIQEPWQPTLRLASPLRTDAGDARGIVIANFAADDLVREIERARVASSAPLQLLDRNGFWLAGAPKDRLWGFMFGRDTTMAKIAPKAWQRISASRAGEFDDRGVHYVFRTIRPVSDIMGAAMAAGPDGSVAWKLVDTVPMVSPRDLWRPDLLPVALAGLAVVAFICVGWSRALLARRDAEAAKRIAETELVRNERLAGLGGLVAGVAHEMNTPIGNAVTVASTLSEATERLAAEIAAGSVRRSALDEFLQDMRTGTAIMLRGLERAAALIGNFKQVAVDQTSEQRRAFRLAELIGDVTGSLQPTFKHGGVTLETRVTSTIELESYPGPLGQVLINLVNNARLHGYDADAAGTIWIVARDRSPDEAEIVVRDNGKGIPADDLERIFDPFFTTRLGDGGSGLGLSIVHNIVTNVLGGTIRAESSTGSGTEMIVRLPRTAPPESHANRRSAYDVD